MSDALRAEWTKLRTIPDAWWLMLGTVVLTVAVSAAVAAATHVSAGGAGQDPTKLALVGVDLGQAVIAALAILAVTDEYGTGMIRLTVAATPRRAVMLGAKAVMVVGLALVTGVLAVTGCFFAGSSLLPAAGLDPAHGYALISIGYGPTLRAAFGTVLYLGLIALLSLGVGTIVRDSAVSTGAMLGLLYLPPLLAHLVSGPWGRHIEQIAPMTAGLAIQATRNVASLPISPWGGLGVLAGWAGGMLSVGLVTLRVRDA